MNTDAVLPADCPEPFWHETHRYCPCCTWTEEPCSRYLAAFQGELAEVTCQKPPGHDGPHESKVTWL